MRENVRRLHELHCHLYNEGTEVITPLALVEEMLERLPSEFWSDPNKRFLDPACGMGTFAFAVFGRLMEGLVDVFPDPLERATHVLQKQLWACDVSEERIDVVRAGFRTLGFEHLARNVYNCDTLSQEFDMKFDVVIGNPPYNNGNKTGYFIDFIEPCFSISKQYVMLLIPNGVAWPTNERLKQLHESIPNPSIYYAGRPWGDRGFDACVLSMGFEPTHWLDALPPHVSEPLKTIFKQTTNLPRFNPKVSKGHPNYTTVPQIRQMKKSIEGPYLYFINNKAGWNTPYRALESQFVEDTFVPKVFFNETISTSANPQACCFTFNWDVEGKVGLIRPGTQYIEIENDEHERKLKTFLQSPLIDGVAKWCVKTHTHTILKQLPDLTKLAFESEDELWDQLGVRRQMDLLREQNKRTTK